MSLLFSVESYMRERAQAQDEKSVKKEADKEIL